MENGTARKMYYDTELHTILVAKLPQFVQGGRISIAQLSQATGYSAYHLYRTFQNNRLTKKTLLRLLKLAQEHKEPEEGRLTEDDLLKFLLN